MINELTEEYKKLIETGTVKEIRDFTLCHFHQIKHEVSFHNMINRLSKMIDMPSKAEIKGWIRGGNSFEKYQMGEISKGLLCEKIAESVISLLERKKDNGK